MPLHEVYERVTTRFIAVEIEASDPFNIEPQCPLSPNALHEFLSSCGDVVCVHCSQVVWS